MAPVERRIAVLLPDLRPGGAERLHVALANQWRAAGIKVDFVLRQARGELLPLLHEEIAVVDLRCRRVRGAIGPVYRYLRERRPCALLAAMWPLTCVAPLAGFAAGCVGRIVVSEHAPQSLSYANRGVLHHWAMRTSMYLGYRVADARVGVSSGVADDMARMSMMPRGRFNVIYNPAATGRVLDVGYGIPAELARRRGPVVLAVGTLKAVKRHDTLIRAFARLPVADATLCILGDGQERAHLEALIGTLGLQDRVLLAGYQSDPAPWYAHADLFVLSSEYEGFGNVIVEALEHGLPVVSTNCPTGPREILEDGKYGLLVPVGDVEALARAMGDALRREHDRDALKRRALEFDVEKAAGAYLDLLLPNWRGVVV